jgi:hypothetical protein
MAKRFIDTEIWKKAWFRKLDVKMKCVWYFLFSQCDHAGIWEIDLELMQFQIGQRVSLDEITACFDAELIDEDKLIIPGFIEFQYGELNPQNRVHLSVINRRERVQNKPLISPLQGAKDKDKDKDLDKERGSGGKFNFEKVYDKYPKKEKKAEGMDRLKKTIKTPEQFQNLDTAVTNYVKKCWAEKTPAQYVMNWASFVGPIDKPVWPDYIDWRPPNFKSSQGVIDRGGTSEQA